MPGSEVGAEIETPEDPDMAEMIVVAGEEYFNSLALRAETSCSPPLNSNLHWTHMSG